MSTLDELAFYCKKENPVGALAFYGESGSGKTYLIEKTLREQIKDTHYIVRVSLFGVGSIDALHGVIVKKWLNTCKPILAKLMEQPEQETVKTGFLRAVNSLVLSFSPKTEKVAKALKGSMDYIVIAPEVWSGHGTERKRVVLVFDDVDRSRLNWTDLLGTINEYCENERFNTILIANREFFNVTDPETKRIISAAKEKTVAYTVLNSPDYGEIVHSVLTGRSWRTEDYGAFLQEQEKTILELFESDPLNAAEENVPLGKHHNIRSLITGLESFYRIYHHLIKAEVQDIGPYFRSFLSFYLAVKSGVTKDGVTCYDPTDEEIQQIYPLFDAEHLFESVRHWIRYGVWDQELFYEELSRVTDVDLKVITECWEDHLGV